MCIHILLVTIATADFFVYDDERERKKKKEREGERNNHSLLEK
jgi:hypothetical protein